MTSFVLALLVACSSEPEAPKQEAKPAEPTCDLKIDALDGTSWVYMKPQPTGPDQPSPITRMKLSGTGAQFTAKYTAGSLGDVYDYSCTVDNGIATCLETNTHAEAWCKAWAAVHDGTCDAAAVAGITGVPQAELDAAATKVNAELAKLKPAEKENQRKVDNAISNKIRGLFKFAVDGASCKLSVQDKYQTMVDGKLMEYDNPLPPGSKFERTKEDYIFETCSDAENAWAPSASDDGTHEPVKAAGAIKFSAVLAKEQKGAKDCAYTADVYKDWIKVQSDVASADDAKYGPRWDTTIPFTDVGRHAVYFDRYKTCAGGSKERIGLACAVVRVE
jgi:hypothetical protein